MTSPDATWRVYLAEWLIVYTSDELEVIGQRECEAVFARKYQGRLRDGDWRIRNPGAFRPGRRVLQLRLPNLKGEYKDNADAVALASELMDAHPDGPCDVVHRGSAGEQALLDYSRKMLPDAR